MKILVNEIMEQGSDAWLSVRKGRPTASRAKDIVTPAKGGLSTSRFKYIDELLAEFVMPAMDYQAHAYEYLGNKFEGNKATDRGHRLESDARDLFNKLHGAQVAEYGFVTDVQEWNGLSPDGMQLHNEIAQDMSYTTHPEDFGLEIKCLSLKEHLSIVRSKEIPGTYKAQCHWSMAVTGMPWYFMSYFPGKKPFIVKLHPNAFTEKVCAAQVQFKAELMEQMNALKEYIEDDAKYATTQTH